MGEAIAFREINQEFESQRFQAQQASRWVDQAQREKISLYGELELRNRLFQENNAKNCDELKNYYAAENEFELLSRFEFELHRRGNYFLKNSNFWCVQSSITHNETAHVPVLWPVCTHTIPIPMLWCP